MQNPIGSGTTHSLREEIESRGADGHHFNLRTVVAMMVPLITELAGRHLCGELLFVHPGSIHFKPSGASLIEAVAQVPPTNTHDHACLAPEQRQGQPGDARASVFACGAVLYELVTGMAVGPGMRRPSEVAKGIPEQFELLIGKALVADRNARPADLAALAQALHQCAPMASIPPPPADQSHLDHDSDFDVDVSLSMMPPPPQHVAVNVVGQQHEVVTNIVMPGGPIPGASIMDAAAGPGPDRPSSTDRLAELKANLEADPRPRYVVIKGGMDHGPFTAVELLQQIAVSSFREEHFLRDVLSMDERQIADWEEFAGFAEHARLNRVVDGERKALQTTVVKERTATQNKALIGGGLLLLAAAAFGGWWFRVRARDNVRVGVSGDEAQFIDFEGGLEGGKMGGKGPAGGGKWRGVRRSSNSGDGDDSSGSGVARPVLAGGMSCAGARNRYVEDYSKDAPPDLSAGAYGAVLNRGTYLNSCGVPPSVTVTICAAVQNGRAVGVTVQTRPANGSVNSCVSGQIRSMGFPSHPRLDITTTVFKGD